MKKTLRGKRHIRARRSIVIGRDRRRAMKVIRGITIIELAFMVLLPNLAKSSRDVQSAMESLSRVI